MRRTILGLFLDPADDDITTTTFDRGGLEVEEVQEDLSGLPVYHGQSAYEGTTQVDAGSVDADGTIYEVERTVEDPRLTEWFAVPDANPGFAAIDASDGEYTFRQLASITSGWVEPAVYDLYAFTDYLESANAQFWQVVWSDSDEAGTWYPDAPDQHQDAITRRGLENHPKQVGFRYGYTDRSVRGTIAASGYCELYYPDDWGFAAMARFIRDELLQFSHIPDVGSAEDIADGEVGLDDLDDEEDDDEDAEDATDDAQTQLDEATNDGGDEEEEGCEWCGQTEMDLHDHGGEQLCTVCKDKAEEDEEESSGYENLDSVTMAEADGGSE